jgi:hypothetical protein
MAVEMGRISRMTVTNLSSRYKVSDRTNLTLHAWFDPDPVGPQREVVCPPIRAWVEEPAEASVWENGTHVAALVPIAEEAGARQVLRIGGSAVLFADDVIDLGAEEGILFVDQAVFAEPLRTSNDAPTKLYTDVGSTHPLGAALRVPWPGA